MDVSNEAGKVSAVSQSQPGRSQLGPGHTPSSSNRPLNAPSILQEKKRLLSFVVVGGGPTGVEVAAELQDMVESDLVKVYPDLIKDVVVSVIELQDHVLSTYDRRISEYTSQIFTRSAFKHLHFISSIRFTLRSPG